MLVVFLWWILLQNGNLISFGCEGFLIGFTFLCQRILEYINKMLSKMLYWVCSWWLGRLQRNPGKISTIKKVFTRHWARKRFYWLSYRETHWFAAGLGSQLVRSRDFWSSVCSREDKVFLLVYWNRNGNEPFTLQLSWFQAIMAHRKMRQRIPKTPWQRILAIPRCNDNIQFKISD